MKNLLFFALSALLAGCGPADIRYTLEGHIEGLTDSVVLTDEATGAVLATLPVTDGMFRCEGRYDEPTRVELTQNGKLAGSFFIEPGNIRIEGKLNVEEFSNHDKIQFYPSGTPANYAYGAHLRFSDRVLHAYNYGDYDDAYRAVLLDSLLGSAARNFAVNTGNVFGVSLLDAVCRNNQNLSRREVDSMVSLFPLHLRRSRILEKSLESIERVFRSKKRTDYTDFTADDATGNPVVLKQVMARNRYVLLDFWFANCMPCRKEMPHIREVYDAYHSRGFEVVGISADKDPARWKKAVAEDGLMWINVIDSDKRVCDLYCVTKFSTSYLIDCSTGKIVARDLRGAELSEMLGQLYDQQP